MSQNKYTFDHAAKHQLTPLQWQAEGINSFSIHADKQHHIPRHQHREHELIVPCAGMYRCIVNGSTIELGTGSVLLLQPGDWHEDLPSGTKQRYQAVTFALTDRKQQALQWYSRQQPLLA